MSSKYDWDESAGLRWLYVDMNSYFASCEQLDDPSLRNRPVMVVPVKSDYTCAIAASSQAKAYGIKTGTKVLDALKLCPDIKIVEARPNRYVELHHQIIETVEDVIPVDRVCSIDEVACRLMGPDAHEAAARAIGHRIQTMILQNVGLTLTASVGIGPSRLLAKTASDMQKPLGLTVLRADNLPGPLLDLDIEDFAGVGRAMGGRLREAGIETVAALWSLSPSRMRKIWGGVVGENFYYALHGIDPPEQETTRGSISHSHVLAKELRPLEQARRVARRLAAKCGSRLRRMDYKCVHLHLSLRGDPIGRVQADIRLAATSDTFKLLEATDSLWRHCVARLDVVKVRKVSINCAKIIPAQSPPDLFGWSPSADEDAKHMALWTALDGLNQRFGKDMITVGPRPKIHAFVGAKIAFNRVPERSEFRE